jgi:hypothetical protein
LLDFQRFSILDVAKSGQRSTVAQLERGEKGGGQEALIGPEITRKRRD